MIDPILTPLMIIMGKYAMDKGVELGKEVGPKALDTAKEIYSLTLAHLRQSPKTEVIVDEFEADPDTYQKPLEKKLTAALEAKPNFAAELKAMLAIYEEEAKVHQDSSDSSILADISGTGSVASGQGTAVTSTGSGISIGTVKGDVNLGDRGSTGDE